MSWWEPITDTQRAWWEKVLPGKNFHTVVPRRLWFSSLKVHPDLPAPTVCAGGGNAGLYHWEEPKKLRPEGLAVLQAFPRDYQFPKPRVAGHVIGMSVPPLMMARVATEVAKMLGKKSPSLFTGPWTLSELRDGRRGKPGNGLSVFSCFSGGGGSTMGYLLAGFDVVGGCEIDPKMAECYRANLSGLVGSPRGYHFFEMPIQEMKSAVPDPRMFPALEQLDVLDGSPPCSSFSMAGSRQKDWGKKKKFREGQAEQVLDDLFFHFIELAGKLRPKIVVAENVKGLTLGPARGYVREIFKAFDEAGYEAQLFLLNAARMGVPQRRERTFFIARRRDLALPPLRLEFDEPEIPLRVALDGASTEGVTPLPPSLAREVRRHRLGIETRYFSTAFTSPDAPSQTLTSKVTSSAGSVMHWEGRKFSPAEAGRIQTFPDDYRFTQSAGYVVGMSVPPLMMQRIASVVSGALLPER